MGMSHPGGENGLDVCLVQCDRVAIFPYRRNPAKSRLREPSPCFLPVMANSSLENAVLKYKSVLDGENNEDLLLSTLRKLERIKMSLEILQTTRIGKTVHKLHKRKGEVGSLSNRIVGQWKQMVHKKDEDVKLKKSMKLTVDDDRHKQQGKVTTSSIGDRKTGGVPVDEDDDGDEEEDEEEDGSRHQHQQQRLKKRKANEASTGAKKKLRTSVDDYLNASMSFEDCLGMSDKLKKKTVKSSSSGYNELSHNHTKPVKDVVNNKHRQTGDKVKQETARQETVRQEVNTWSPAISKMPPLLERAVETPLPTLILPEIKPDYRPMRNHFIIDDSNVNLKKKTIERDDNYFLSSRHNRTQVFSGRKNNFVSEIPTLKAACLRVLKDNPRYILEARRIHIAFDVLEPVIERLTPNQLYELEQNNEHLTADTDNLWEKHCQRDFKNRFPDEDESWQELYWRLVRERESKLKSITANISASMAKSVPVRQTKLAYLDCIAKPPRAVARQQAKFGTGKIVKNDADKHITKKAKIISAINASVANSTNEVVPLPSSSSSYANSSSSASSSSAQTQKVVKKVAPLMQKTLKFLKNRFRR